MAMASGYQHGELMMMKWVWDGLLVIGLFGLLWGGSEASAASHSYCDDVFCHRFNGKHQGLPQPEETPHPAAYWKLGPFTWRSLIDLPKLPPLPFFPSPSPDSPSPSPSLSPLPTPSQSQSQSPSPSPSPNLSPTPSPWPGLSPPSPSSIPALAPSPSSPAHSSPLTPPAVLPPPAWIPMIISPALSPDSPAATPAIEERLTSYAASIAITAVVAFSVTLALVGLGVFLYRRSWKPKDDKKLLTENNGGSSSGAGGFISSTSEVWNLKPPPPPNKPVHSAHVQTVPHKHYHRPGRVSQPGGPTPNPPSSIDSTSEVSNDLKPHPNEYVDILTHTVQSLPNKHHHRPSRVSQSSSSTLNPPPAFPLPSPLKEDTTLSLSPSGFSTPSSTFSSPGTTFSSYPSPLLSRPTTTTTTDYAFAIPHPLTSQTYNHGMNQPGLASPFPLPSQTYNNVTSQFHSLGSPPPSSSQTYNPIGNLHSSASPSSQTVYNPVILPTLASPPLFPSQTYYPVNLHSLAPSSSFPSQTANNPVNPPSLASPSPLPSQTYNPANTSSVAFPPPLPSQTYNPINQPSSTSQPPLASFNAVNAPHPTLSPTPPRGPPPPPPPPRGPPPPPPRGPPLPPRGPPPPPLPQGLRPPPPPLGPTSSASNTPQLRPFHWEKFEADSQNSTVWGKVRDGSFVLDEDVIESLFGAKTTADRPQAAVAKPKKQEILDSKKAQNIAIQIRALNLKKDEICSALLEGDGLNSELLELLVKMSPSPEEQKGLINYSGDEAVLEPAERFLKSILEIPFAFERMRCMLYKACFKDDMHQNRESLQVLEVACEEVKSSRLFIKILEAVLKTGNRMNQGTHRGDAEAFKLDTLLKLSDIKSADGKTTLLCFVVEEIVRAEGVRISGSSAPSDSQIMIRHRELSSSSSASAKDAISEDDKEVEYKRIGLQAVLQLSTELANVTKAASVDMNDLVQSVNILTGGLNSIKTLLQKCSTSDGELPEDSFFEKMSAFIQQAGDDIGAIQKDLGRIKEEVNKSTAYFHGRANQSEPLQLFVIVRDFLGMLEKVCVDLGKNLKSSGGG